MRESELFQLRRYFANTIYYNMLNYVCYISFLKSFRYKALSLKFCMNFFEACKRSYDFNMRYKGRKFSTLKKMYNFSNDIGNFIKYLFFILRVHFISVDIQIQTQAAFVNKVNFSLFTFSFLNFFLSGYVLFVGQSVRVIFVINIFLNISTFFHYHQINRKSCEYRHKKIGHNQINVDKQNNKIFEYT